MAFVVALAADASTWIAVTLTIAVDSVDDEQ